MKTQVSWFSDEGLVVSKVPVSLWIYVQLYKHSSRDPEAALYPDSIKWLSSLWYHDKSRDLEEVKGSQ